MNVITWRSQCRNYYFMLIFKTSNWKLQHINCLSLSWLKTCKFIIQDIIYHPISSPTYAKLEITWEQHKELFINKKISSLLFILVQGSIGKEPVRKPDVVADTTKFKYIFHNITFQMKSLLNPSQCFLPIPSKLQGNTRRPS